MPGFLQNSNIHAKFNNILENKYKKPIILDSIKCQFKKEFCEAISFSNNIKFIEYTFDQFMTELPYVNNENSIIYVNDFLIGNGRILNHYEEMILLSLNKNTNQIILNSDYIHKITFKDDNIIRLFEICRFPTIVKKDIIKYINFTILKYKYNDYLYNIDWNKHNFQNINFEKINILLFELNNLLNENKYIYSSIDNEINKILDELYNI
jgi:hypothetical protein